MRRASVVGFALILIAAILLAGGALGYSFIFARPVATPVVAVAPGSVAPVLLPGKAEASPLSITRVAHATVLLDFDGVRVLTDPWFTQKWHFHQGEPLGMALADLPRLDLIVASHAHYDHFDIGALAAYPHKDVPFLVGPDMAHAARAAGFTNVQELVPEQVWSGRGLTVTGVAASHKVPEVTFIIQAKGRTVYFGGDTLSIPELRELPKQFPVIDLALLSVNGLTVMGQPVVMSAEEAAELAGILRAKVAVPIHYRFVGSWFTDTFILSRNGTPERFEAAAKRVAPDVQVRVLDPGQRLVIERETQQFPTKSRT
jgi:L-ascorbate metabolism protein UlaG (beta-lactamase superfamily)